MFGLGLLCQAHLNFDAFQSIIERLPEECVSPQMFLSQS
jgi:hypothetical protein